MDIPGLDQFITSVPSCYRPAPWTTFLDSSGGSLPDYVVLVDEQHYPLGVLRLSRWVNCDLSSLSPDDNWLEQYGHLIEPVGVVLLQTSLEVFWPELARDSPPTWVAIDGGRRYVGVIDTPKILKQVVANPALSMQLALGSNPSWNFLFGEATVAPVIHPVAREGLQKALASRVIHHWLAPFPIPLMVLDGSNQPLASNAVWQSCLGNGIGLDAIAWRSVPYFRDSEDPLDVVGQIGSIRGAGDGTGYPAGRLDGATLETFRDGYRRLWRIVKFPLPLEQAEVLASSQFDLHQSPLHCEAMSAALVPGESPPLPMTMLQLDVQGISSLLPDLWLAIAIEITDVLASAKSDELSSEYELLRGLSHELKVPLTSLLGLSNLLKDERLGQLNLRQSRYSDLIYQNIRYLVRIVNDVLDLTRLLSGELELAISTVDIEALCESAYVQAQTQVLMSANQDRGDDWSERDPSNRCFQLKIDPQTKFLAVDPLRLKQILVHLLTNALKFSDPQEPLGLKVECQGSWLVFHVWDLGIGIPEASQANLFQLFQRFENPVTNQFTGAGLGLVLAQRLVWLHGGEITFVSTPGEGSCFSVLIPAFRKAPLAQTHQPMTHASDWHAYDSRLVILAADQLSVIQPITQALGQMGYGYAIARTNADVVSKVRRLHPHAVLIAPGSKSLLTWDCVTLLQQDAQASTCPIIGLTAPSQLTSIQTLSLSTQLSLPVDANQLKRILDSLYRSPRPVVELRDTATLTILYLRANLMGSQMGSIWLPFADELNSLLQTYQCRILEVDDPEQAELLVRVWKPDVILLDPALVPPAPYIQQICQQPSLSKLPLVTLTSEMTQAANSSQQLAVFPCLILLDGDIQPSQFEEATSVLMQVIQVAASSQQPKHSDPKSFVG